VVQLLLTYGAILQNGGNLQVTSKTTIYEATGSQDLKLKKER